MTHPGTQSKIKRPILELINREFGSVLSIPDGGPQEFPLLAIGKKFRADFAYRVRTGGWCFIEDDSAGTCLSNLLKYSAWIEENNPERPIWVFHVVSPENSAWVSLCKRESGRLNRTLPGFVHVIITTPDWSETTRGWLNDLHNEMKRLPSKRE
jgi:hypothetical protein